MIGMPGTMGLVEAEEAAGGLRMPSRAMGSSLRAIQRKKGADDGK
jgi:hypothetical protein